MYIYIYKTHIRFYEFVLVKDFPNCSFDEGSLRANLLEAVNVVLGRRTEI